MMPVMFQCNVFSVTNGFFSGLKVHDLRTGKIVKADRDLTHTVLHTWTKLARFRYSSPTGRRLAEDHLFYDFGRLLLEIEDEGLLALFMGSPDFLSQEYARRAEMEILAKPLGDEET